MSGFSHFVDLQWLHFFSYLMDYVVEFFRSEAGMGINFCISMSAFAVVVMHLASGLLTEQFGTHRALLSGPIGLGISLLMMLAQPYILKKS